MTDPVPLFIVVRPGRGLLVATAVAAALAIASLANRSAWQGVWSATINELGIWMVLAAPVTAASAGWIASGNRRSGLDHLAAASTLPLHRVRTRLLLETWAWTVVGYGAALAISGSLTSIDASAWSLPVLLIPTQLAFLALFVVLGLVVGRYLPPWFTIPALGAGTYVGLALLLVAGGPTLEWLSPVDNRTTIVVVVDALVLAARALWLIALVVALLSLWSARRNVALVAVWVAGLALSPLLLVGSADRELSSAAAELV